MKESGRPPLTKPLRSVLVGERPLLAALAVVVVALGVVASYAVIARFDLGATHPPGTTVLLVGIWAIPALVGIVCGLYRLGFLAALVSGLAPIAVIYTLQIVTEPDGDLHELVFAIMIGGQSVPFAIGGFVLGLVAALVLE